MSIEKYKVLISSIGKTSSGFKPHRLIALLCAIDIVFTNDEYKNIIFYNEKFKRSFTELFTRFSEGNDSNRPHTPFFHLHSSGLWKLHYKAGRPQLMTVGSPKDILENIEFATLEESFYRLLLDENNRIDIKHYIFDQLSQKNKHFSSLETPMVESKSKRNPFVVYLNTMQSVRGNNTGALAEFQAQSENFALIEEEHPLTERICKDLLEGHHVVLTGHAGDGKSTIALGVYRRLANISGREKLMLSPIMNIEGTNISIVKDLSENKDTSALLSQILSATRSYLLVSNTGALLKMFNGHEASTIETEARLLQAFNGESTRFDFLDQHFVIYNLAKLNNLPLAERVFRKMLDAKNWQHCQACPCQDFCGILRNRNAIADNNGRAVDRMFLVYQRLLAYGHRLTMRQLMEHLAWTLTGGQDKCDIEKEDLGNSSKVHSRSFFHLFWGNNGLENLKDASQMQAIRALRNATFGSRLSPEMERTLWTASQNLPALQLDQYWKDLASRLKRTSLDPRSAADVARSRSTLRRILYFLADSQDFEKNIDQYLDSAYTRQWQVWQAQGHISSLEKKHLTDKIFAVLYEQFSGHQSEDVAESKVLYLTQHRNAAGLRQSVQLLTAQIRTDDEFDVLKWERKSSPIGTGDRFVLSLPSLNDDSLSLDLDIAFLDYVERRYQGELEGSLSAAYQQRLETFKTALAARSRHKDQLTLVRTLADKNTSPFSCLISNGKLVVQK